MINFIEMKNLLRFYIFSVIVICLLEKSLPVNSTRYISLNVSKMIYRELWGSRVESYTNPLPRFTSSRGLPCVIIHDTGSSECYTEEDCSTHVLVLQELHISDYGLRDISYNFLIGSDGNIYEGRGWYKRSDTVEDFSDQCISIAIIGSFEYYYPNREVIRAFKEILDYGEGIGYLHKNYSIVAHRQFDDYFNAGYFRNSKLCPGKKLYDVIQSFPHWVNTTITINHDFYEKINRSLYV